MKRRSFLWILAPALGVGAACAGAAAEQRTSLRGALARTPGGEPALRDPASGRVIRLTGDDESRAVLLDSRLRGMDFEVAGHLEAEHPEVFAVDPIHLRALSVYREGKRMLVTYWCDVCSIRTYSPGKCMCCQKETIPDFVDPATFRP